MWETVEERIAQIEEKDYSGHMPSANRQTLRNMLEREDRRWGERCEADFINGFDDGEAI